MANSRPEIDSKRPSSEGGGGRKGYIVFLVATCFVMSAMVVFFQLSVSEKATSIIAVTSKAGKQFALMGEMILNTDTGTPVQEKSAPVIAYAISISSCPTERVNIFTGIIDGPAVLAHSIHLQSIQNPESNSKYDYKLYAFVHPDARSCTGHLPVLNFTVKHVETPINVSEIKSATYRERVQDPTAGCCKEKEFLKLYSLTLQDHPIVVHLDTDVFILKAMDELYDEMLKPDDEEKFLGKHAMWPKDYKVKRRIETFYTRDYPMGLSGWPIEHYGMQGGFWIVRPNLTAYEQMRQIILEGKFQRGWYDDSTKPVTRYPGFYGCAMIQGLVSFYYGQISPGQDLELNHCHHDNMADNPYLQNKNKSVKVCTIPAPECPDCRLTNLSEVYSFHATFCGKPWQCHTHTGPNAFDRQCQRFFKEWHRIRYLLETQSWNFKRPLDKIRHHHERMYYGFCRYEGGTKYVKVPYKEVEALARQRTAEGGLK